MFLSAQAFADLKGKGLICELSLGRPLAIYFREDYRYIFNRIYRMNDEYYLKVSKIHNYYLDESFIHLGEDITGTSYMINRKTLEYVHELTEQSVGNCKVYDATETSKRHRELLKKLQQEYNKKLEGNKI